VRVRKAAELWTVIEVQMVGSAPNLLSEQSELRYQRIHVVGGGRKRQNSHKRF
jgi:hypothetical protein